MILGMGGSRRDMPRRADAPSWGRLLQKDGYGEAMQPAKRPIKTAIGWGLVNTVAWALEKMQWIPDWAPYAVLAISVPTLLLIFRSRIAELWPLGSQIHLRSPFFLANDTQRPVTTPETLAVLADGWVFRKTNDGARVLVDHRGVYKIMEADAYAYFEKLRDIEKTAHY